MKNRHFPHSYNRFTFLLLKSPIFGPKLTAHLITLKYSVEAFIVEDKSLKRRLYSIALLNYSLKEVLEIIFQYISILKRVISHNISILKTFCSGDNLNIYTVMRKLILTIVLHVFKVLDSTYKLFYSK